MKPTWYITTMTQPPSSGCVLKLLGLASPPPLHQSAAFERLCVETSANAMPGKIAWSAAFERLCVETLLNNNATDCSNSAAFERLCVETQMKPTWYITTMTQPPSSGCVLKHGCGLRKSATKTQPPSSGCVLKHPDVQYVRGA